MPKITILIPQPEEPPHKIAGFCLRHKKSSRRAINQMSPRRHKPNICHAVCKTLVSYIGNHAENAPRQNLIKTRQNRLHETRFVNTNGFKFYPPVYTRLLK